MIDERNDDGLGGRSRDRREVNQSRRYGARLLAIDPEIVDGCAMNDDLRDALAVARKIQSPGPKKRQIAYIDKLLRGLEQAEIRPIERLLAAPAPVALKARRAGRAVEKAADALLADDAALSTWVESHPDVDLPRLRTLIRNTRKDPTRRSALLDALRGE